MSQPPQEAPSTERTFSARYWDPDARAYLDVEVVWNGTLHRADEDRYSLLGSGWQIRRSILRDEAPARDAYPSRREIQGAHLAPSDSSWRQYRPKDAA